MVGFVVVRFAGSFDLVRLLMFDYFGLLRWFACFGIGWFGVGVLLNLLIYLLFVGFYLFVGFNLSFEF